MHGYLLEEAASTKCDTLYVVEHMQQATTRMLFDKKGETIDIDANNSILY
jgi:hypothetical protein